MIYNVKISDLPEDRRQDFYATLNEIGRNEAWGQVALTINPLESWLHYGFGGFKQEWFQRKVASIFKGSIITVDTLNADLQTLKEDFLSLVDYVNTLEERLAKLEG